MNTVPLRIVTFKVDEELLRRLDCYAAARGVSRSEAIREAIKRLLEEEGVCRPAAARLYRCPVCGAELPLAELRRHAEKHLEESMVAGGWRCPICSKIFATRDRLLAHLARTSDERHAQLWALLPGRSRGRGYTQANGRRRELIEKLAAGAGPG